MRDYIIIFGAAVRPRGTPGPALQRRIDGAIAWAKGHPDMMIMPTGGLGANRPAEAEVIEASLIAAGIDPGRIVIEDRGRDTLESVRLCDRLLRQRGDCRSLICCTSSYHQPRCALLLRLLGYRVVVPDMPDIARRPSRAAWARLVARELIATPYDAALLLIRGRLPLSAP
jgi:uncharacterized SAM-binding protein YcdF (DUF218 family)